MARPRKPDTIDRRPEATNETKLLLEYLLPYLNGMRKLWPETQKKTLWPSTPGIAEVELQGSWVEAIRGLVTPIFEYYMRQYFSDYSEENTLASVQWVFTQNTCVELYRDSFQFFKMLSVVAIDRNLDSSHRRADPELLAWLRSNVGQMVLIVDRWEYHKDAFHHEKPKQLDQCSGPKLYDWGRPQFNAILVYWLIRSFEKVNESNVFPNGEYFIGICKKCKAVFQKKQARTSQCSKCNKR